MYKFLSIIVSLLLMINMSAFAADIELQPTMRARTNAQDRVWVGTLQLVWNDFISKYVHNPVRFREGSLVVLECSSQIVRGLSTLWLC